MTAASWITRRWRSSGYGRWTRFSTAAHPEEVATALGLHGKTVYGWLKKYRDGGQGALLVRPVPGRPPRLAPLQMRRPWTLVAGTDPRQLQFDFALWTTEMVRALIRREFGVGLSAVSVGRLLGKMGLSQQRPLWRAYQQNPEAVTRWKQEEYAADQVGQAAGVRLVLHRGGLVRPRVHAGQASCPGQAADPLRAHRVPVPGQVRMNAVDAVPALMRLMDRDDKSGQRHVFFLPR